MRRAAHLLPVGEAGAAAAASAAGDGRALTGSPSREAALLPTLSSAAFCSHAVAMFRRIGDGFSNPCTKAPAASARLVTAACITLMRPWRFYAGPAVKGIGQRTVSKLSRIQP